MDHGDGSKKIAPYAIEETYTMLLKKKDARQAIPVCHAFLGGSKTSDYAHLLKQINLLCPRAAG